MNRRDTTNANTAVMRQEEVVERLQEQLQDAIDGQSLKPVGDTRRDLKAAQAKLRKLRGGFN
ncbi:hypothetical protein [Luteimonas sp. e5]